MILVQFRERAPLKTGLAYVADLVLMALAVADRARPPADAWREVDAARRLRLVSLLVLVFAFATSAKALIWKSATDELRRTLLEVEGDCIERGDPAIAFLEEPRARFLRKFSLPVNALLFQSPPRALVLDAGDCKLLEHSGRVRLSGGWAVPHVVVARFLGPLRPRSTPHALAEEALGRRFRRGSRPGAPPPVTKDP
jgi:hypothetical protein